MTTNDCESNPSCVRGLEEEEEREIGNNNNKCPGGAAFSLVGQAVRALRT